jgi:hypothetical protein
MICVDPDTLQDVSSDELLERQRRTGEIGNGLSVYCSPDPLQPGVWQVVSRSMCLFRPYPTCVSCPHRVFELIFEEEATNTWVLCPRWKNGSQSGVPDFYTPCFVSDCRAKPYPFCLHCPSREELLRLHTDKQKSGWLERYNRITKDD